MATAGWAQRNVVVMGRTGGGKSTVANKILGREAFDVRASCQSVTSLTALAEGICPNNTAYHFKVVDTIGMFDTRKDLSNRQIVDKLKSFARQNIPEGISLFVFVFRVGRFTAEEKAAFGIYIKNFKQYTAKLSAMVITHCDMQDETGRQAIIADFRTHQPSIAKFMEKGIYAVGFPDTKNMKPQAKVMFEDDMENDSNMLEGLVLGADRLHLRNEIFTDTLWDLLCRDC